MSNVSNITSACKGVVDQMNRSSQGWRDDIQKAFYERRLNPLIGTAAEYKSAIEGYIRLLEDYNRQIASLVGISSTGGGIGERELFLQQIDPSILSQIINRQR